MSSEISIDDAGRLKAASPGGDVATGVVGAGVSPSEDGFRPWHFFVLASILLATVAVILTRRSSPDHLILLSLTIAAAGAAAGAFYRMLVPLVTPLVTPVAEPLNQRARAAVQREKTLVLRSIKELEFDRAMGKVSQKDYDEMVTRLRSRALSLMKQLEAEGYEAVIERELQARLAAAARPAAGKVSKSTVAPSRQACAACGIANDLDALFCKKCGTRLQA